MVKGAVPKWIDMGGFTGWVKVCRHCFGAMDGESPWQKRERERIQKEEKEAIEANKELERQVKQAVKDREKAAKIAEDMRKQRQKDMAERDRRRRNNEKV